MNALDLFCGCGGLSSGLSKAGIEVLAATDNSALAIESHSLNHPNSYNICCDANSFLEHVNDDPKLNRITKSIDLVVGGPPCQGFCGINRYRNENDDRNSLIQTFYSIIAEIKPRYFLMENVNGLLSLGQGKPFKELLRAFKEIGYFTHHYIIQAGGFGLPQNRWRVFILGSLYHDTILPPEPLFSFPRMPIFDAGRNSSNAIWPLPLVEADDLFPPQRFTNVEDAIGDLPALENGGSGGKAILTQSKVSSYTKFLNPGNSSVTDHECGKLGEISMERVKALPPDSGASWVDLPPKLQPKNLRKLPDIRYRNRYGRLKWDGIFNTILHKPEPYWGRILHPSQNRVISVRECARAQGFPDDFQFLGKVSEKYLQVGNAVPPILGMFLGWQIQLADGKTGIREKIQAYGQSFNTTSPSMSS